VNVQRSRIKIGSFVKSHPPGYCTDKEFKDNYNKIMTRKDLIDNLQEKLKDYSKKDLEYAVRIVFESIKSAMAKGKRVEIRGFGNFTVRTRNSRMGRNPGTGEPVYIVKKKVSFFKAGKKLKKMVDYTS